MDFIVTEASRKGCTIFVAGDFAYSKMRQTGDITHVRCCKYQSKKCKSIGRIIDEKLFLDESRVHTCKTNAATWEKQEVFNSMKTEAMNTTTALKTVYQQLISTASTGTKETLSFPSKCLSLCFAIVKLWCVSFFTAAVTNLLPI